MESYTQYNICTIHNGARIWILFNLYWSKKIKKNKFKFEQNIGTSKKISVSAHFQEHLEYGIMCIVHYYVTRNKINKYNSILVYMWL